jgi:ABC-type sugar transport system permease subunit
MIGTRGWGLLLPALLLLVLAFLLPVGLMVPTSFRPYVRWSASPTDSPSVTTPGS